MNGQVVEIFDSYVEFTIDGVKKTISLLDFKSSLDSSMSVETTITPIILPRNVIVFGATLSQVQLNTYWPASIHKVSFQGGRGLVEYTIPFPNVVISFDLSKQNDVFVVKSARYFCTESSPGQLVTSAKFLNAPDKGIGLMPLPLPNLFGDCRACYGRNSMPSGFKDDFRGLDWYYMFLMNTPFNSDLSILGVSREYRHAEDWLKFLAGKEAFPYNLITNY